MEIYPIQRCLKSGDYTEIDVPSRSDPEIVYTVLVTDVDDLEETICECKGYLYQGRCAHQLMAHSLICGWMTGDKEEQTENQRHFKECPRCGGPTEWSMEVK